MLIFVVTERPAELLKSREHRLLRQSHHSLEGARNKGILRCPLLIIIGLTYNHSPTTRTFPISHPVDKTIIFPADVDIAIVVYLLGDWSNLSNLNLIIHQKPAFFKTGVDKIPAGISLFQWNPKCFARLRRSP